MWSPYPARNLRHSVLGFWELVILPALLSPVVALSKISCHDQQNIFWHADLGILVLHKITRPIVVCTIQDMVCWTCWSMMDHSTYSPAFTLRLLWRANSRKYVLEQKHIYIYICRTIKSVQFILYYIAVVCFCIKLFQFCGRNFTLVSIEYSQEQSSSLSNVGSCLIHVLLYRGITVYGNWKPLVKYIYMNECKWKLEGCSAWNNVKCQLDATR